MPIPLFEFEFGLVRKGGNFETLILQELLCFAHISLTFRHKWEVFYVPKNED